MMNTKRVLWATDKEGHRHLLALQLLPEENKVKMISFPRKSHLEELHKLLQDSWRRNKDVDLPEDSQQIIYPLSITSGGLLPEHLEAEQPAELEHTQHEWHFIVLSYKFFHTFEREWQELQDRVKGLEDFNKDLWTDLKNFWTRVEEQVRDKNLMQDHARALRKQTDALFDQMKSLRKEREREIERQAADAYQAMHDQLDNLETRIEAGEKLRGVFNELKNLQKQFKKASFSRSQYRKTRKRIDDAFKAVRKKRFGAASSRAGADLMHLEKRYEGLLGAIQRMERSIGRDQSDLDYEARKIARSNGQLEAQIRQAKVKMIEERKQSKSLKLEDMLKTKAELEQRKEALEQKVAKDRAREEARAKKEAEKAQLKAARKEEKRTQGFLIRISKDMAALAGFLQPAPQTVHEASQPATPSSTLSEVSARLSTLAKVLESQA